MNLLRPGLRSARIGGTGPAVALAALVLALACPARGVGAAPAGATLGSAGDAGGRAEVRVFASEATVDTLAYPWQEVFPVVVAELERDHWTIQRADTASRRVVTRWKDLDHLLARIALGEGVHARCVVDLAPLAGGATQVTFRSGLASADDLDANPAYAAGRIASGRAAERWLGRLKAAMSRTAAETALTR